MINFLKSRREKKRKIAAAKATGDAYLGLCFWLVTSTCQSRARKLATTSRESVSSRRRSREGPATTKTRRRGGQGQAKALQDLQCEMYSFPQAGRVNGRMMNGFDQGSMQGEGASPAGRHHHPHRRSPPPPSPLTFGVYSNSGVKIIPCKNLGSL